MSINPFNIQRFINLKSKKRLGQQKDRISSMRFTKITIQNFRQYRNISFEFPKTKACDMHIIVASNGVGKTNLMNAVNWCLYGDEPHLDENDLEDLHIDERLSICNLAAIEESKKEGTTTCPVFVEISCENSDGQYIFRRTVHINVKTLQQSGRDEFEVRVYPYAADMYILSGKECDMLVDRYLPKKIREYFYFDGEKLLNYLTNTQSKTSKIRDSIYEIAGLNFIHRSSIHLSEFKDQFQNKITELSPDLKQISKAMNDAKEAYDKKEEEIKELSRQIAQAEEEIAQANMILDGTENSREANAKYDENKRIIERENNNLTLAKNDLVDFVNNYFAKIMMFSINQKTLQYIEEREAQASINPEVNINAIKDSIDKHECRLCMQHIPHDIEVELKKLVTSYETNISMKTLIGIKSDIKRSLNITNYSTEKEKIFNRIRDIENRISDIQSENEELWKIIETVSDIQGLEKVAQRKKENEDLRDLNLEKRGQYSVNLELLKKKVTEATADYNAAVEKDSKCGEYREKYQFVSQALEIVNNVKKVIIDDIKKRMQDETMNIFDRLLWKKDTYERVELDDNFRLQLYHRLGQSCLYSCSAAEKELLALSFTIALHNVSGYDNLLFIDTPVGRVSDINRVNFAKVLLEVSQDKQIILAFTPSEFSSDIKSILNSDVISSYNHLIYEEDVTEKDGKNG